MARTKLSIQPKGGLTSWVTGLFDNFAQDRQNKNEVAWTRALEAYKGSIEQSEYWKKGEAGKGGREQDKWRSNAFPMLIKTKVIAFYSIITEMILQGGEFPFDLIPNEGEPPEPSDKMKSKIRGQLQDCKADREMMKNAMSLGLYGGTYLKGKINSYPKPGWRMVNMAPQGMEGDDKRFKRPQPYVEITESPAVEYRSVWDIFRDMEHEDIQKGQGIFDRTMMSNYDLRKKQGQPYFDDDAIDSVITTNTEGIIVHDQSTLTPNLRDITERKRTIRYLEGYLRVPLFLLKTFLEDSTNKVFKENFDDVELDDKEIKRNDGREMEVMCCLANDKIIRLVPFDSLRPFKYCPCELVLDEVTGQGIAENLFGDQKMIAGVTRNIIDNLALAGSVVLAGHIENLASKESPDIHPGAWLELAAGVDNVLQAIQQFIVQDVSGGLLSLREIINENADADSNVPKILEGAVTNLREQTKFETDVLQTNAGKYIGGVIRNIDEYLIEPTIRDFYDYNMSEPASEQGNFETMGAMTVNANGFSSFMNRYVKVRQIRDLLLMALSSPELAKEVKIRKHLDEIYKGSDVTPEVFLKTEQEKAEEHAKSIEGILINIAKELQVPLEDIVKAAQPAQPGTEKEMPEGEPAPAPAQPGIAIAG